MAKMAVADDIVAYTVSDSEPPSTGVVVTETDFIEYQVSVWLMVYLAPLIIVVGTVGNGVSVVVLRHVYFRDSPISFPLSALAVTDIAVLYTALLRQWLMAVGAGELRGRLGHVGCQVHFMLSYYLQQLSSWTLVLVTVERTVCVALPLAAKAICTRRRVVLLWVSIAVTLCLLNVHFFWTTAYKRQRPREYENATELICAVDEAYHQFFRAWNYVDMAVYCIVPFVIIFAGNVVIIACIVRAIKFRRQQHYCSPTTLIPNPLHSAAAAAVHRDQMTSQTAMLVGVCVLFLFTTAPYAVYFVVTEDRFAHPTPHQLAQLRLANRVASLLCYVNNAVNFVMYCLVGTRFRRTIVDLFRCWGRGRKEVGRKGTMVTLETRLTVKRDTGRRSSPQLVTSLHVTKLQ